MQIDLNTKKIYWNNDCPFPHMTLDDNMTEAKKIEQGFDFDIVDGAVQIKTKTKHDKKAFKAKLTNKTATLDDIQEYLLAIM